MSALTKDEFIFTRPSRGSMWLIDMVGLEPYQYRIPLFFNDMLLKECGVCRFLILNLPFKCSHRLGSHL